ncbi:MAG: queuosine precursor transporter [Pseudomonadota bacterium]
MTSLDIKTIKNLSSEARFCILACAFTASWGMMQLFVVKQVPMDLTLIGLGVTSFVLSEFLFAITFPITDVVTEVWGAKRARAIVYGGALVNLLVMIFLSIAVMLPAPEYWQAQNSAYNLLYEAAPRIWVASISAVVVSQLLDIYVFKLIRGVTGDRLLWLRNNGSTLVSQAVDTVIFYMIAFYGLVSNEALISLLIGNYLLKIVLATADTPVVYLLVRWARGPDEAPATQASNQAHPDVA